MLQRIASLTSSAIGRESHVIRNLRPLYESTLRVLHGDRGIPWDINGERYQINPHYRSQLGHHYDQPVAEFLRHSVKPGFTCFDVGANVGVYVLQLARWSAPGGRVIGFEPNPGAWPVLESHVRMNHLEHVATIERMAIGAKPGTARLYAEGTNGMSRLGAPNHHIEGGTKAYDVQVETIDRYIERTGIEPDMLLIDIEGFEYQALLGAKELLKRKRDLLLMVEMHPNFWDSADTKREAVEKFLREYHLTPVSLTGNADPLSEYGTVRLVHAMTAVASFA